MTRRRTRNAPLTLEDMIAKAQVSTYGTYKEGRFGIALTPVGRPSQGLSSAAHYRLDCYLDGKRVAKAVFLDALGKAERTQNAIGYEWVIEPEDNDGDIIEVSHRDTLREALEDADAYLENPEVADVAIGLVRDAGDEIEGVQDRQWAYLEDNGELPYEFDGGARVPQRFHEEARRERRRA